MYSGYVFKDMGMALLSVITYGVIALQFPTICAPSVYRMVQ